MGQNNSDVGRLYDAIYTINVALHLGSLSTALDISERVLKESQNPALDRAAHEEDLSSARRAKGPEQAARVRKPRKREEDRRRLLELTSPELMLAPVNVVAVYLRDQPMWPAWDWASTHAVNSRMLSVVQRFDEGHPLPDDDRLALPLTAAGTWLYQALQLPPLTDDPSAVLDVYGKVAQAVVLVDRCLAVSAEHQIKGDVSEAFLTDFAETTDLAETLLLHAIRLGPEMWRLILCCPLGAECRLEAPFYVTAPNGPPPHPRCRTYKSRMERNM